MWNPFREARERAALATRTAALEREAYLQTLATIADSFAEAQRASHEAVAKLAEASTAQASALQQHLSLFSVSSAPVSRTMRDADEFAKELERNFSKFPNEAELREQLNFVLAASADPEH